MARPGSEAWILLVDPETVRRRDRTAALEGRGYRVLPASDAEVADAVLRTQRVDVVVFHQDASPAPEALGGACRARGSDSREDGSPVYSSPARAPMIVLATASADAALASVGAGGPVHRGERQDRRLVARLAEPVAPTALEQVVRNMIARSRPVGVASLGLPAAPRPTRPHVSRRLRTSG